MNFLIGIIIFGAIVYLYIYFRNDIKKINKSGCSSCSSCSSCSLKNSCNEKHDN